MSDHEDEGMRAAMQKAEGDFQDIIRVAMEEIATEGERNSFLVSSGFALGWSQRGALHAPAPVEEGDFGGVFRLLLAAGKEVSNLLLQFDVPETTVALSNEIATCVGSVLESRRKRLLQGLTELYGEEAARLLMQEDAPNSESAFVIGMAASSVLRGSFAGFLLYRGDKTMECRCPMHLAAAFMSRENTPQQVEAARKADFPLPHLAVEEFGRYLYAEIAKLIESSLSESTSGTGKIDVEKAKHEADGFMSRLLGKEAP